MPVYGVCMSVCELYVCVLSIMCRGMYVIMCKRELICFYGVCVCGCMHGVSEL